MDWNADETELPMVPKANCTMAQQGSNAVDGDDNDDKRSLTGFLCGARTGEAAPLQLIYKGIRSFLFILYMYIYI